VTVSDTDPRPSETIAGRARRARSFGAHADAYDRARPGYPAAAARWLVPGSPRLVVELGAGTGKLTRALAALGVPVLAVEPDERMRDVLTGLDLAGVEAVAGAAEAIPVGDGAADVVVSGSAFHWFDLDQVLAESARALGEGGVLSFAWNARDSQHPAVTHLNELLRGGGEGRPRGWPGDRPWEELVLASGLFGTVEQARFPHELVLPRDRIGDLVRSYSRVGMLPPNEQQPLVRLAQAAIESEPELDDGADVRLPYVVTAFRAVRSPAQM
jgi:SAM-dependent methyltransferase